MLAALGLIMTPWGHKATALLPPVMRFGVAGPNRAVPIVHLDQPIALDEPLRDVGTVVTRVAGGGRGGGDVVRQPRKRRAEPAGPHLPGLGEDTHDLVGRAFASQGRVPIFQSDELVIEHLVRPEYPEDARARGAEGKVSVLALVDTLGRVVDAEVMNASGEGQLDHAAESAVRQCRFRPYRESGVTREVYAVFRFAFRIY